MGHSSATFCIDCGWSGEHGDLAVDELGLQCPNCAALIAFVENRCTGAKVS